MSTENTANKPTARAKSRKKNRIITTVIMVAILGAIGYYGWGAMHPVDDPTAKMITDTVKRGDLSESVTATGSVTGQTGALVKIGSQITGRIKRLYADIGSKVVANQLIAELDLPDIEAQVNQATANYESAKTKLQQQESGVGMQATQLSGAVLQAQAGVNSSKAKLASALATEKLTSEQTPSEIRRAQNTVNSSRAALSTAESNLKQVMASANLQIATAQEQLNQTRANSMNAQTNLKRQQDLFKQGFVAASTVDDARTQSQVLVSQVQAAQQNVLLIREKVAADKQSAIDQEAQAQQTVESAKSAFVSAQATTNQYAVRLAEVNDARQAVKQAEAIFKTAQSNTGQNIIKQQDVLQAQEAVKATKAQLDFAKAQYDKTFIRSPISGTVLQLAAQQGETLAAGLSAPTLIVVADLSKLQVDVYVDETDIEKVKLGQIAEVSVDAFAKKKLKGKVVKVASGSTIQQGVVTYDVTIALEKIDKRLKPDMTATAVVQTGTIANVLLVPSEAVKVGTKGSTVNVLVTKDGKKEAEAKKIITGASDGVFTQIISGIDEGATIILAGAEKKQGGGGGASSPFGPSGGQRGGGGGRRGG